MKNKKIDIVLATYNSGNYISEQLDSIISQTYDNWICYIHDDGSSDETKQILEEYAKRYTEKFVLLSYASCGGACKNFLSLLKYAKDEYVMFSDQDDVWLKTKIQNTIAKMLEIEEADNRPCAVFTDLEVVDKNLNTISKSFMRYSKHYPDRLSIRAMMVANPAPGCALMVNQALVKKAVKYKNPDNIEMHDWWCMVIASTFGEIAYVAQPSILYRQHGDNALGAINRNSIYYYCNVIKSIIIAQRLEDTRGRIRAKRNMAKELCECFPEEDCPNMRFIMELADIEKEKKNKRIAFYIKNHLYNTLQHGFWIMLMC